MGGTRSTLPVAAMKALDFFVGAGVDVGVDDDDGVGVLGPGVEAGTGTVATDAATDGTSSWYRAEVASDAVAMRADWMEVASAEPPPTAVTSFWAAALVAAATATLRFTATCG